jgi:hypothetical protein
VDNDYKIEVDDENLKRYNVIMLKHFQCFDSSINSMQIEYRCGFENNDFSQLPNNLQNLIIKITVKRIATLFRICNQLLDADIKTLFDTDFGLIAAERSTMSVYVVPKIVCLSVLML